jgi:hypothetical protein
MALAAVSLALLGLKNERQRLQTMLTVLTQIPLALIPAVYAIALWRVSARVALVRAFLPAPENRWGLRKRPRSAPES